MLWKIFSVILLLANTGCPLMISQKVHSGKDYHAKGAKKIKLEDGEGRSRRDVVTYPGGDRVDWKTFSSPTGKPGRLRIKLRWKPARPQMDLAFRVYNEYFEPVGRAKPTPSSGRRSKAVIVKNAEPATKYYVQIYAPRRSDAASYRLYVRYHERQRAALDRPMLGADDIPEPPTLPAIPEVKPEKPPEPCPNNPARNKPNCEDPVPPPPLANPVKARVVKYQLSASGTLIITLDHGKNSGIEKGWKGQVQSSSGRAVQGGGFTVIRVTSGESVGKVRISVDQLKANKRVVLTAPQ